MKFLMRCKEEINYSAIRKTNTFPTEYILIIRQSLVHNKENIFNSPQPMFLTNALCS
uniref:Uncharacterized protein n=1 Tax=Anguilla anguilla TaxID=7936 RepID=A0A0E9RL06_ANGAN